MMMKVIKYYVVTLLVLFLSGCSSTEDETTQQYLLPYPAAIVPLDNYRDDLGTIRLKSVTVPSYLQKQNMVLVNENGQVYLAANHLWAESVARQLEQKTVSYLSDRLPKVNWLAPILSQVPSAYLSITVENFYASTAGDVTVSGYWSLWGSDNKLMIQGRFNEHNKLDKQGYLEMTKMLSETWFDRVLEKIISSIYSN
jgi:uncharacterized protein